MDGARRLAAFLVVLITALAALQTATAASASAAATAGNRVGASNTTVGVFVGPPEHIAAGQWLGNDRSGAVAVVATVVAANNGDHIVLGLREGLDETAAKVGGRTLLKDPNWMSTLQKAISDPATKFTVSLDGLSGTSTYSQIAGAATRGAAGTGGYTDWEMSQLFEGGRLPDATFIRGGSQVENPWGPC